MFTKNSLFFIIFLILAGLLGTAYVSLSAKYERNLSALNEYRSNLQALDSRTEKKYSEITNMLSAFTDQNTKTGAADQIPDLSDGSKAGGKLLELINQQNLYLKQLSSRISSMESQLLVNRDASYSDQDSNSNINRPDALTAEQMDHLTSEDLRQGSLHFNELDAAFLDEVENTAWGNDKSNTIVKGIETLKLKPEYQNFDVTGIDCRETTCKIQLHHYPESFNQELVIMELITMLDGELVNIEVNTQNNADGSTNAVYYLSRN